MMLNKMVTTPTASIECAVIRQLVVLLMPTVELLLLLLLFLLLCHLLFLFLLLCHLLFLLLLFLLDDVSSS